MSGFVVFLVVVLSFVGVLVLVCWCLSKWAETARCYLAEKEKFERAGCEAIFWKNECARVIKQRDQYHSENQILLQKTNRLTKSIQDACLGFRGSIRTIGPEAPRVVSNHEINFANYMRSQMSKTDEPQTVKSYE